MEDDLRYKEQALFIVDNLTPLNNDYSNSR